MRLAFCFIFEKCMIQVLTGLGGTGVLYTQSAQ